MVYFIKNKISKKNLADITYILAFLLYASMLVIETTMFNSFIPRKIRIPLNIISIILVLFKIIAFDLFSFKELIFYPFISLGIILVYIYSGYSDIVCLLVLLLGAKNISLNKIIKSHFIVTLTIVVSAIICSKLGIIQNLQYSRPDGTLRQSFGSVYPTDFAAHIFYLILSYFYIKKHKILIKEIFIFFMLSSLLYKYCDARLDSGNIIIALLAFIWCNNKPSISKITRLILTYSLPIFATVSICVTILYGRNYNYFLTKLNELLSYRLSFGNSGIEMYGISFFGQKIFLQGNGGTYGNVDNYFFIDCSYILILLKYGIVFSLILMVLFIIKCTNNIKIGNIKLPLIILLIGINCMIAHHFLDLAYNPFIMMLSTPIDKEIIYETIKKRKVLFFIRNKKIIASQ